MKHVIVGTAGHIDHGKTTLIKALTGRNTDRLKEEQKRGISIDLGFTYFDLPSGTKVGIVDAPGHERFIKNMLAGVMGIDVVLLIIAADEGIMPQTIEHLNILDLIGVKKGLVVLTKADLVDNDWIDMVEEEIRERLEETTFKDSKILRVSSTKGTGIPEVIDEIERLSEEIENTEDNKMARLPIDRVFKIKGFGTVVTGTLVAGMLNVNDEVEVYPKNKISKIRSIQVHDEDVKTAFSGQRVAINLPNIKKTEIERGDVIAPVNSLIPTMMLDAKLKLLEDSVKSIANRTRVRVYIGSKEVLARVILVDRDELKAGEEAVVQFRLEEVATAQRGDRFIIRFYSPMFTIGGGEIIDANPKKRKRFNEDDILLMESKANSDDVENVESLIKEHSYKAITVKDLVRLTSMQENEILDIIADLLEGKKIISYNILNNVMVIHVDFYEKMKSNILEYLTDYHKENPFREGISKEEVLSKFFKDKKSGIGDKILYSLATEELVKINQGILSLYEYNVSFDSDESLLKKEILEKLDEKGFNLIRKNDFVNQLDFKDKAKNSNAKNIFNFMLQNNEIILLNEDLLISKATFETAYQKLVEFYSKKDTLTLAEYRDILDTNRKSAMSLLDEFDSRKITVRKDDYRELNSSRGEVLK